jgi:hypothetical protein
MVQIRLIAVKENILKTLFSSNEFLPQYEEFVFKLKPQDIQSKDKECKALAASYERLSGKNLKF